MNAATLLMALVHAGICAPAPTFNGSDGSKLQVIICPILVPGDKSTQADPNAADPPGTDVPGKEQHQRDPEQKSSVLLPKGLNFRISKV